MLLFALASATVTGLFCGLAPAIEASRTNLVPALKAEAGSDVAPAAKRWRPSLASTLVVAQVAFSLILVVAASLLTRSVSAARLTDLGFEAKPLGVLTLDLDTLKLEPDVARGRIDQLVARVEALPGVAAAGVATRAVLGLNMWNGDFYIPGFRDSADDPPIALEVTHVDPGYFDTMGLELLEGRLFDERDRSDTTRVAVVTESHSRGARSVRGRRAASWRVTSTPPSPSVIG